MRQFESVRTGTWEISIPKNWVEVQDQTDGALHFGSEDGEKAFYIETWRFDETPQTPEELIESFIKVEIGSLHKMKGRVWETLVNTRFEDGSSLVAFQDSLDRQGIYRIASKVIAAPPIVVRASFHDYACRDYQSSLEYFSEMIASLRLVSVG